MNILVACEESQEVCKELRKRGHRAFSCDIQNCSGGHPEWHIMDDVTRLINGDCTFILQNGQTDRQIGRWDMLIAFPPCTHLAVSGAKHFEKKRADGRQREGIEFFCMFLEADCDKIAIENPIGIISGDYVKQYFPDLAEKYGLPRKQSQIIQPYFFGHKSKKSTCLWLKNLPCLVPTDMVEPELITYIGKNGKKSTFSKDYCVGLTERAKDRSKTYHGVAVAMATQWTEDISNGGLKN